MLITLVTLIIVLPMTIDIIAIAVKVHKREAGVSMFQSKKLKLNIFQKQKLNIIQFRKDIQIISKLNMI